MALPRIEIPFDRIESIVPMEKVILLKLEYGEEKEIYKELLEPEDINELQEALAAQRERGLG
ncbi:hypothetical protein ACFQMN_11835 [Halobacillus campisalis]|uniref:Uncharacterized protein n=1 Tax=Halobacillus campisalis TaxID=435909 RepID=A0ABW2K619_9BACI|nr:hypothetical protein [Halobacillus campisalis]